MGTGGPDPPEKNTKMKDFLAHTDPDPLKTKPAFNVWPSSARQRFPHQLKKQNKKTSELGPLWQNFVIPRAIFTYLWHMRAALEWHRAHRASCKSFISFFSILLHSAMVTCSEIGFKNWFFQQTALHLRFSFTKKITGPIMARLVKLKLQVRIQRGGGGPDPLENHKLYGFL